ncbi:MAG: TIGR01244 family phosphatase [Rhodobacteraceae bacterium]|nr:TIGR01244 family phosphatase [Paracoccaceae bacterium]
MDIRPLTDGYAVSPQIAAEEATEIAAAGFKTVICNRPDGEVPPEFQADAIRAAVEAAGMTFVVNPVVGGAITPENVSTQGAAIAGQPGPILAYCASGNRSSIVWAMSQAAARPVDELIAVPARYGYNLEPFRPMLEHLSNQ